MHALLFEDGGAVWSGDRDIAVFPFDAGIRSVHPFCEVTCQHDAPPCSPISKSVGQCVLIYMYARASHLENFQRLAALKPLQKKICFRCIYIKQWIFEKEVLMDSGGTETHKEGIS